MSNRSQLIFRTSAIPYPGAYVWRAAVNSDVDGDTVWVERDSGCRSSDLIELRLTGSEWKGFDADERFTEGGKAVTAEVRRVIPEWSVVRIETKPDTEKFGRWLSPILVAMSEVPADIPRDPDNVAIGVWVLRQDRGDQVRAYLDLAAYLVWKFPTYSRWKAY